MKKKQLSTLAVTITRLRRRSFVEARRPHRATAAPERQHGGAAEPRLQTGMKTGIRIIGACLFSTLLLAWPARATELFVSPTGTNAAPYATWAGAAKNIQDAIDAASSGDTIWVTNGVYADGGKVMAGDLANRVALDKALLVRSVNGPFVTTIQGLPSPSSQGSSAAVRCAWLTNGASLVGFTLQNGGTRNSGDVLTLQCGGGVWCASSNAVVSNCRLLGNAAQYYGAACFRGALRNSLLQANDYGSTADSAVLCNCTVDYNWTGSSLGAVNNCLLTNCIVYWHDAANYTSSTLTCCCATPLASGAGNIASDPLLLSDGVHLASSSPCGVRGTNLVTGTDLFGLAWSNPPSLGCSQLPAQPWIVTQPALQLTNPAGFAVTVEATGNGPLGCWWYKDGVLLDDDGHYSSAHTSRLAVSAINDADAGGYQVVLSNSFGMVTSAVAPLVIHFVSADSPHPAAPYLDWTTAAATIQDAIESALPGEVVLVTNGVYSSGGKARAGDGANRVVLDKPILVKSVNGFLATVIQGNYDPADTNGPAATRCAWLTNGATLHGFTLQGGATLATAGTNSFKSGGGAWCVSSNAYVFNCWIRSNSAAAYGGGAYFGTLRNCFVTGNQSAAGGGGACGAVLCSCTVVSNTSPGSLAAAASCLLTNCIVYFNQGANWGGGSYSYCCTTPAPGGVGNTNGDPQLMSDGLHLGNYSPCRGKGTNLVFGPDFLGHAWFSHPSMGATEWQQAPYASLAPVQFISNPTGFSWGSVVAGQANFSYWWVKDGARLQDDGHYSGTQTATLHANSLAAPDAGNYQLIVSNAYGGMTSAVSPLVIHFVDAGAGVHAGPYLSWATAAATLQDAVDAALPGEVVLAANGVYATGGKAMDGDLLNRIAVDKALFVLSANGPDLTTIRGAWDPSTTNGPLAVRCAWLTNGATLSGFRLEGGATRSSGSSLTQRSGGGLWGASSNALAVNCVIATNAASFGGGGNCQVSLNRCKLLGNRSDSLGGGSYLAPLQSCALTGNSARVSGGGVCDGTLVNCTVTGNSSGAFGAGLYNFTAEMPVLNSIVYDNDTFAGSTANFYLNYSLPVLFTNSCTLPKPAAYYSSVITNAPQLVDGIHLATTSPCRGVGNAAYSSGLDFDGEAWANPPSMGCDEVWEQAITGPLAVALTATPAACAALKGKCALSGSVTGRASRLGWSFGDGTVVTNASVTVWPQYTWTNPGDYTVTFTGFNADNPDGVSKSIVVHVSPLVAPVLSSGGLAGGALTLTFPTQPGVTYNLEKATNLAPPVVWRTVGSFPAAIDGALTVTNTTSADDTGLFRIRLP
jgi:PKD repeat protein